MHTQTCSVQDCTDKMRAVKLGLCNKHLLRLTRHGDVNHTRPTPQSKLRCSIDGCQLRRKNKGLCSKHRYRLEVHGSPDIASYHVEKHGMIKHPLYVTWSMMRRRCHAPNATGYDLYGGRGISVCDRWRYSFSAFVEDVGDRPAGHTIDRIDVNGNYEPANVRWATASTQLKNQNTRSNNTSGHKGVSWDSRRSVWRAYKGGGRTRVELGCFADLSEAIAARHAATLHDADVICCPELTAMRSGDDYPHP